MHDPPRWITEILLAPRGLNLRSFESILSRVATSDSPAPGPRGLWSRRCDAVRASHFGRLTTGLGPLRSKKIILAPLDEGRESASPNCYRVFVPRGKHLGTDC